VWLLILSCFLAFLLGVGVTIFVYKHHHGPMKK
jgi:hypothetical protein